MLKMRLVTNYRTTRCHKPADHNLNNHHRKNFKTYNIFLRQQMTQKPVFRMKAKSSASWILIRGFTVDLTCSISRRRRCHGYCFFRCFRFTSPLFCLRFYFWSLSGRQANKVNEDWTPITPNSANGHYPKLLNPIHTCLLYHTMIYINIIFQSKFLSSKSGLENREYGRGDPLRWPRYTVYPQKLALTSPTSGGRSVGRVRLRTKDTEFVLLKETHSGRILRHNFIYRSCFFYPNYISSRL
jgi:hypothetical protein